MVVITKRNLPSAGSGILVAAIEDAVLFRISFDELEALLQEVPVLERYFRTLYAYAYAAHFRRLQQFIGWSATRRYTHLLAHRPDIVARAPQKVIASYIGVTPESLSRIRRKVARDE